MQIATWNINSLTVRLPQVLDWLAVNPVEVLCLQELKLSDENFPIAPLLAAGYHAAFFGQKTYNGVALLSRHPLRGVVRNLTGFEDEQARVVSATIDAPGGPLRRISVAASAPTARDTRAPYSKPLARSRPSSSLPSQWAGS